MPKGERHRIESCITERIKKASLLGNHYRKNLHIISKFLPDLLQRLEEANALSLIPFGKVSPFCMEEMELIRHLARSPGEALDLLGCYYSLHLIFLNLNCLDLMEEQRSRVTNRTAAYKEVLLRAEAKFSILYSALIQSFLEILSEGEKNLPEFVICHVGARRDQDDIDVGIIHRPGGDLAALNRVVGRLNREMVRRATQMHFYLSEHSGSKWFSACIDVYEELMDVERKNLVIITQLFGAVPIVGSISLFEEFQERVVRRYTYRVGRDNRYYEGFMRGVVEEIRSLVAHQTRPGEIVPKVDGLRLGKILIAARRANLGIVGGHFWKVFKILQKMDPLMQEEYATLEESLVFLELLRFLLHLIFVQEEGVFYTDDYCRSALDRVARSMGYGDKGKRRPSTDLLRDYFRYSQHIKEISGVFKEEFKKYVEFIQVFRNLEHLGSLQNLQEGRVNLATDYVEIMARFHRKIPWREFIGFLQEEDPGRERFIRDLLLLDSVTMYRTLERYARTLAREGDSLIRFLLCLLKSPGCPRRELLESALMSVFREALERAPQHREMILRSLMEEELLRDFLQTLSPAAVIDLLRQMKRLGPELRVPLIRKAAPLAFFHHFRSRLIARKVDRLVRRGLLPEGEAPDPAFLHRLSEKVLPPLSGVSGSLEVYEVLQDYHDLETLAFAFHAIETKRFARAAYMDRYVRQLGICACREAGIEGRSGFGIYATGGNAQGRALDNDYDMFVLCDASRVVPASLMRAVHRIHRELTRVGNFPHHRIAEKIGSFVIPLEGLAAYLDRRDPEDYIERTELLGSRRIFGDPVLHRRFEEEMIVGRVFREKERLIRSLSRELRERYRYADEVNVGIDLKQGKGGLFDISLLICLVKVRFEIFETSDGRTQRILKQKDPDHAALYDALFAAKRFLSDVRGMLCLTGFSEEVREALDCPIPFLLKGFADPADLVRKVEEKMRTVLEISEALMRIGKR